MPRSMPAIPRRVLLGTTLAAPWPLQAQEPFPTRPVRLVLPFGPGGVSDTLARLIAEHARPLLGQKRGN